MDLKRGLSLVICLVVGLACRITSIEPQPTATSTPLESLTLHEAWRAAEPQVRAWAADARPGQRWTCQALLTAGGCQQWSGLMGSAARDEAITLIVSLTGVELKPTTGVGPGVVAASFSPEQTIDSRPVLQTAWRWLEEQGLRQAHSRVRSLALLAGPSAAQGCGETPHYQVVFESPSGQMCLDAASGQVTENSWE